MSTAYPHLKGKTRALKEASLKRAHCRWVRMQKKRRKTQEEGR